MSTTSPDLAAEDGPSAADVRPPRVLGFFVALALAVSVVATVVAALTQWHMRAVLEPLDEDAPARTADGYQRAEMWLGNASGVQQFCLAATAVLFAVWLFRMRAHAKVLAPDWQQRHGVGWLLLSFLCLIGLLVVPKMITNDVWAASSPPRHRRRGNALLTCWWLAVVAAVVPLTSGFRGLDEDHDAAWLLTDVVERLLIADLLVVPACVLTFVVARRLTALQANHPAVRPS